MKKHIVLINTWRTISSVGGTEKVLCDMANALTEHSYNVTIICFETKKGQPAFPLNKEVRFINVFDKFPLKSIKLTAYEKLKCFSLSKIKRKKISLYSAITKVIKRHQDDIKYYTKNRFVYIFHPRIIISYQ